MTTKVDEFLSKRKENSKGENQERWQTLEELHSKKLWHPLILRLKEYINTPEFFNNENLVESESFNTCVNCFTNSSDDKRSFIADPQESCKFLENIKNTVKNDREAVVLCVTGIVETKLNVKDGQGRCLEITDVRNMLEDAEAKLDELEGVTSVHGEFHRVNSVYLREVGEFGKYYKEALRYLGCIDINEMTNEERQMQAFCLGLAALLGEDVYNFGELLAHPILESLKGTKETWLVDLLYAFNRGDMARFEDTRAQWGAWDDLKKNTRFLDRKIRLLCLMEVENMSHRFADWCGDVQSMEGLLEKEAQEILTK